MNLFSRRAGSNGCSKAGFISGNFFRAVVLGCLALVLVATGLGCGKKGPPLPPIKEMVTPPVDLAASINGNTATLTWFHRGKKGKSLPVAGFEIDMATRVISPDECKGCPLRFTPIDTVAAETFEYSIEIKPGLAHYFRVRAYTEAQVFSDSSSTVQVELDK